jgi:hypothetical protein
MFRTQYFDVSSGSVWSQIADFEDTSQWDRPMTAAELAREAMIALQNGMEKSELTRIVGECVG